MCVDPKNFPNIIGELMGFNSWFKELVCGFLPRYSEAEDPPSPEVPPTLDEHMPDIVLNFDAVVTAQEVFHRVYQQDALEIDNWVGDKEQSVLTQYKMMNLHYWTQKGKNMFYWSCFAGCI